MATNVKNEPTPAPDPDTVRFDWHLQDTELGWMQRVDRYARIVVPIWFNLISWLTLIGGLEFLRSKSGSKLLGVIIGLSIMFMWRYLVAVFGQVEWAFFRNVSRRTEVTISELFSGAITIAGFVLIHVVVRAIASLTTSLT